MIFPVYRRWNNNVRFRFGYRLRRLLMLLPSPSLEESLGWAHFVTVSISLCQFIREDGYWAVKEYKKAGFSEWWTREVAYDSRIRTLTVGVSEWMTRWSFGEFVLLFTVNTYWNEIQRIRKYIFLAGSVHIWWIELTRSEKAVLIEDWSRRDFEIAIG